MRIGWGKKKPVLFLVCAIAYTAVTRSCPKHKWPNDHLRAVERLPKYGTYAHFNYLLQALLLRLSSGCVSHHVHSPALHRVIYMPFMAMIYPSGGGQLRDTEENNVLSVCRNVSV